MSKDEVFGDVPPEGFDLGNGGIAGLKAEVRARVQAAAALKGIKRTPLKTDLVGGATVALEVVTGALLTEKIAGEDGKVLVLPVVLMGGTVVGDAERKGETVYAAFALSEGMVNEVAKSFLDLAKSVHDLECDCHNEGASESGEQPGTSHGGGYL